MADQLTKWEPHPKQAEFLAIPPSIKEAAYLGGAGSAKSETLLVYALVNRWHEHPRFKQVFMRRTFPELRNEIVPRSRYLYTPFGAKFNGAEMCWTFPSGAMIFLGHCENQSDVTKYDSMEINLFTPDEITSFTEYIYLYIGFQRTRAPQGSGLPAIIRAAGMPGGIGHGWVKKRFVDPYPEGGKIIVGRGGNKRLFIFATQADNPHIDPKYKQSLEALPEAEKRARLYGDFNAYLGQVFDEFRDQQYPDEPENALHVIEPFEIPIWWPKFCVIDWGYAAMTWIGYFAVSPERRVYLYREQHWRKKKIEEWAPYCKNFLDKEQPRKIKLCKSAGQERGQEHTIQQQIEFALDTKVELTENAPGSRIAGKLLIHEYLRWKPKEITPQPAKQFDQSLAMWVFRNKGQEAYQDYINSFKPQLPESNLPKYQIFNTCNVAIESIKACVYAKPKEGMAAEDVAQFDGDDPYDGQRYGIDEAEKFFNDAADEFSQVLARENIIRTLESNQDWTMFYRNMAKIESEELTNNRVTSIKRFARRH